MKKIVKNYLSETLQILSILGSVIFAVIISTFIGASIPIKIYWYSAIVICLIVVSIYYGITYTFISLMEPVIIKDFIHNELSLCTYTNQLCCSKKTLDAIKENYTFSPSITSKKEYEEKYSLFLQEEIIQKESLFSDEGGKEIWIVSSKLETETSNGATDIVGQNLIKGIKYNEFYSLTDPHGRKNTVALKNIKIIKKMYDDNNNIYFIAYKKPEGGLDGFIFELFGIVIYEYKDKINAYFSIRASTNKNPIYFKMPECMGDRFFYMLKDIKHNNI